MFSWGFLENNYITLNLLFLNGLFSIIEVRGCNMQPRHSGAVLPLFTAGHFKLIWLSGSKYIYGGTSKLSWMLHYSHHNLASLASQVPAALYLFVCSIVRWKYSCENTSNFEKNEEGRFKSCRYEYLCNLHINTLRPALPRPIPRCTR